MQTWPEGVNGIVLDERGMGEEKGVQEWKVRLVDVEGRFWMNNDR